MSILVFPKPHPDELFYGVLSRYIDRLNPERLNPVIYELFGKHTVPLLLKSYFPRKVIEEVCSRLPRSYPYSSAYFFEEHTAWRYYKGFSVRSLERIGPQKNL